MPALVADKVMEALSNAKASVDSVTLSMIMKTYLDCDLPRKALTAFEAAVGFRADGASQPLDDLSEGWQLRQSDEALDLFTGSVLMKAHAQVGDLDAVERVLLALEGNSGADVNGLESAPWPFTGLYGTIKPDTVAYNVALSAAERIGGSHALELGMDWFGSKLQDPATKKRQRAVSAVPSKDVLDERPVKDLISYNTMMSLLVNEGCYDEAFELLEKMKRSPIRPDIYTYTALIKACVVQGDVEELLYDMKENKVKANVVTYNTLIKSLCETRQWTEATKLVNAMESRGIAANSMTYSYLMHALLKADKPKACLVLFDTACVAPRTKALMENAYVYTTAIAAAAALKDTERALILLARMAAMGLKPSTKTLTAVMGACLSGGQPEVATQIYKRIKDPDGYAMLQCIRAYSANGDLEASARMLRNQQRRGSKMSGKQLMMAYNELIKLSVQQGQYEITKRVVADLLRKGYIPKKILLQSLVFLMGLEPPVGKRSSPVVTLQNRLSNEEVDVRFDFLLFLLDSLQGRKLDVDGRLYAAFLVLSATKGGSARKLAAALVEARARSLENVGSLVTTEQPITTTTTKEESKMTWRELWHEIENEPSNKRSLSALQMPPLAVQIASNDVRRVFRAEQVVDTSPKKKKSTKKFKKPQNENFAPQP